VMTGINGWRGGKKNGCSIMWKRDFLPNKVKDWGKCREKKETTRDCVLSRIRRDEKENVGRKAFGFTRRKKVPKKTFR